MTTFLLYLVLETKNLDWGKKLNRHCFYCKLLRIVLINYLVWRPYFPFSKDVFFIKHVFKVTYIYLFAESLELFLLWKSNRPTCKTPWTLQDITPWDKLRVLVNYYPVNQKVILTLTLMVQTCCSTVINDEVLYASENPPIIPGSQTTTVHRDVSSPNTVLQVHIVNQRHKMCGKILQYFNI